MTRGCPAAAPNIAAGEFSDGSRLGAAGGTAFPIPFSRLNGQQTVTGVGLLVDDDRVPDGFCTGVFKVGLLHWKGDVCAFLSASSLPVNPHQARCCRSQKGQGRS